MFELSLAYKYLVPKKKSLSTALISLMSVLVISLVVWLVLIFLSVISGIEKNWLQKLTSLHAPVRLSPTEKYYNSYYYQIDALASNSNYTLKTIGEKYQSPLSDPYSTDLDAEIPPYWPKKTGEDPVKEAFNELADLKKEHPEILFQDYEISGALLRLNLMSPADGAPSFLSQMSYLLSLTEQNPKLRSILIEPTPNDLDSSLKKFVENGVCRIDFESEPETPPPWVYFVKGECRLPQRENRTPVLLPKNYKEGGVRIGTLGSLNYMASSAASSQEQKIDVRIVGFYDPGVLSIGNKCAIVPVETTRAIHAANRTFSPDGTPTNGIFVWTDNLTDAALLKKEIESRLEKAELSSYWKAATFEEFEFSKDLMLQFRSDRTLFLLIAAIILIVACSNVISLLVLLVNDKKKEIAILQSMGASFKSIASIFGICGALMGALSCLLGSLLALFTLRHLDSLVSFLSYIQGRSAFNPAFFGKALPNELSYEALLFVLIATPLLSFAAGLIPAIKASRIRPSCVLRSE
ncbi:MAG: hypothetical protein A3E80_05445 [Chlamydiae bacterium RIFCSPHIGHO2_12_FULL_49_9]|nr:MAG: hypothetical protein A3E80_05445 [Chlamydiae bacterium RIFCSPHIGHO2_12_FULL_49_9]